MGDGIDINGVDTSGNLIAGNSIGISADGSENLGNQGNGISINDASNNTIGGESDGAGNVIGNSGVQIGVAIAAASSGSTGNGVFVTGQATGNLVQGDYIGITASGQPAGNSGNGVLIEGASNNTIGGTNDNSLDFISANGHSGVMIVGGSDGTYADGNLVQGVLHWYRYGWSVFHQPSARQH